MTTGGASRFPRTANQGGRLAALIGVPDRKSNQPRGNPRPRVAMMLRWISLVPAAIVPLTLLT